MSTMLSRFSLRQGLVFGGKYRLKRIIGVGGFGEVWEAAHVVQDASLRDVALKFFHVPHIHGGGGRPAAWRKEALTALHLVGIASVPQIYDVDLDPAANVAFIVMELLCGEVLASRIARGPIGWRHALSVARSIARTLAQCHARGIVHCDLKPQNIFLAGDKVVVLDFGIASLRGSKGFAETAPPPVFELAESTVPVEVAQLPQPTMRQGGLLLGTPGYIAPEQLAGAPPDTGADVYALGVVLYSMIAGRLPYREPPGFADKADLSDPEQRKRHHLALNLAVASDAIVPLREAAPEVPIGVARLVDRLLTRQPERLAAALVEQEIDAALQFPYGKFKSPYLGLGPFRPEHAGLLYGRTWVVERALQHLVDRPALIVVGPSGCGKSSLAQAGIAAQLDAQLFLGMHGWTTLVVCPSADAALRLPGDDEVAPPGASVKGVALVVDQLEELLKLPGEERRRFCAALMVLLRPGPRHRRVVVAADDYADPGARRRREHVIAPGDRVRVIVTLRDDALGELKAVPWLRALFDERDLVTLEGVDPNEATSIVCKPARAYGLTIEDAEVIGEVAKVLRRDPLGLPLIQFALARWWQRDGARQCLDLAGWEALGGVDGGLYAIADEFHDGLDKAGRRLLQGLLVDLFCTDGSSEQLPRHRVPDEPLVAALIERRLVRWREVSAGEFVLEVAHTALFGWPRLKQWMAAAAGEKHIIEDARRHAAQWRERGLPIEIPKDLLWSEERLRHAYSLRERLDVDTWSFIQASWHHINKIVGRAQRLQRLLRIVSTSSIVVAALCLALAIWAGVYGARVVSAREQAYAGYVRSREAAEEAREQITRAERARVDSSTRREKERKSLAKQQRRLEREIAKLRGRQQEIGKTLNEFKDVATKAEKSKRLMKSELDQINKFLEQFEARMNAPIPDAEFCQKACGRRPLPPRVLPTPKP